MPGSGILRLIFERKSEKVGRNPRIANFGTGAPGRTADNMGFYRRTIVCTQKMSITEERSFLSMRAKAPEANRGGETWNHSKQ